jgi:hypothetical protein
VVPYILRILEHQHVNSETDTLIEFIRALYLYAHGHAGEGIAVESATKTINNIDNSVGVFRKLLENPLARDAALRLISEIENR